jgi:hypothetical protein
MNELALIDMANPNNYAEQVTGQHVVERFGEPGEGMWRGEDGVWRFEDQATYAYSPDNDGGTPPPSDEASRACRA